MWDKFEGHEASGRATRTSLLRVSLSFGPVDDAAEDVILPEGACKVGCERILNTYLVECSFLCSITG